MAPGSRSCRSPYCSPCSNSITDPAGKPDKLNGAIQGLVESSTESISAAGSESTPALSRVPNLALASAFVSF